MNEKRGGQSQVQPEPKLNLGQISKPISINQK